MTLKPGDKVRITSNSHRHMYQIGSIVTIKRVTNSSSHPGKDEYECKEKVDGYTWHIYTGEYEIIPPPITLKLKQL